MTTYLAEYTPLFEGNLKRYHSLHRQIRRRIGCVVQDPYAGTERLGKVIGGKDLRGCRSVRVTRNFRIIFVVCEECRRIPECGFCFWRTCPTKPSSSSLSAPTIVPTPSGKSWLGTPRPL